MTSATSAPTSESVQHQAVDTEASSPFLIEPIVHVVPTAPPALIHPMPIHDSPSMPIHNIPSVTFTLTSVAVANTSAAVAIVTWFPSFYPSDVLLLSMPSFSMSLETLIVVPWPVLSFQPPPKPPHMHSHWKQFFTAVAPNHNANDGNFRLWSPLLMTLHLLFHTLHPKQMLHIKNPCFPFLPLIQHITW
jgi:hypothetical protein